MSEECRALQLRISQMQKRVERMMKLRGMVTSEIDTQITELRVDIHALQVELTARRYDGDSNPPSIDPV